MKNTKTLAALLLSITILTGFGAAAGETLHPTSDKKVEGATLEQPQKLNIIDQIGGLLSVTTTDSGPYQPGETINFDVEVKVEDDQVKDGDAVIVTEFYNCQDSGCDDPNSDEFLGAERRFIDFGTDSYLSGDWSMDVAWGAPTDQSHYAAVGYMYDTKDGEVVSNDPKKIFEVTTETQTEPEPEISQRKDPSLKVVQSEDLVIGTTYFENTGGEMTSSESHIVEMQVRDQKLSALSLISRQKLCDPSVETNVHKEYPDTGETIQSGDEFNIALQVDNLEPGKKHVYFMTRSQCANADGSQERVQPYKYSHYAGTVTVDSNQDNDGGDGSTGTTDSDGDGVADSQDECPTVYGNKDNGCPKQDSSGLFAGNSLKVIAAGLILTGLAIAAVMRR